MSDNVHLDATSTSVQAHLGIIQQVIQRMSGNSASCKAWCITLVSAILVIVADKDNPDLAFLAFIPVVLFLALDSYYLALERAFRASYNTFIDKLHEDRIEPSDLYSVEPSGGLAAHVYASLFSFSVWPVYLTLGLTAYLARVFVL